MCNSNTGLILFVLTLLLWIQLCTFVWFVPPSTTGFCLCLQKWQVNIRWWKWYMGGLGYRLSHTQLLNHPCFNLVFDSLTSPRQLPTEEEESVLGLSAVTISWCLVGEISDMVLFSFFFFWESSGFSFIFWCFFQFLLYFLMYSKGSFSVLPWDFWLPWHWTKLLGSY